MDIYLCSEFIGPASFGGSVFSFIIHRLTYFAGSVKCNVDKMRPSDEKYYRIPATDTEL